ncbi:hypothetical protein ACS0TY_016844 [Phlomoides rotata]
MAAFPKSLLFSAIAAVSLAALLVSSFQFEVGETMGWKKPIGNESKTYNEWAAQNRFRIGDTLYFKYENDSVLVVNSADYLSCNSSNPISKFEDGNTVFRFDRSGFFYFISGGPGHCKSGQRLIIRVMHPSQVSAPGLAPAPAPSGGGGSEEWEDDDDSSAEVSAASCFVTAASGLFAVLCLFM